jgi:hypothetical protein
MTLLSFCEWCEKTSVGTAIRESLWLFPAVESVHLLALGLIGGAILVVDARLFGWGLSRQSVADAEREARPWLLGSLAGMFVSGVLLFLSEATKCYYNAAFWAKMIFFATAVVFTFTFRQRTLVADERTVGRGRRRLIAVVSVLLWAGVGISGRYIGFY